MGNPTIVDSRLDILKAQKIQSPDKDLIFDSSSTVLVPVPYRTKAYLKSTQSVLKAYTKRT